MIKREEDREGDSGERRAGRKRRMYRQKQKRRETDSQIGRWRDGYKHEHLYTERETERTNKYSYLYRGVIDTVHRESSG